MRTKPHKSLGATAKLSPDPDLPLQIERRAYEIENQSFMRLMLSKMGFHMRLVGGGVGVVNRARLAGCTVYPGVAQVPGDPWMAEPITEISTWHDQ